MDPDTLADLFSSFGPVQARRMFGGAGLYADGLMFAIEAGGTIYLKADGELAAVLGARGSRPFSYEAKGQVRTMAGFWSVPEAALDDADDLAALARRSLDVARAADAMKVLRLARKAEPSGRAAAGNRTKVKSRRDRG